MTFKEQVPKLVLKKLELSRPVTIDKIEQVSMGNH